jgi:7-keto-8-aminopelargonate synthetase-like enzyme
MGAAERRGRVLYTCSWFRSSDQHAIEVQVEEALQYAFRACRQVLMVAAMSEALSCVHDRYRAVQTCCHVEQDVRENWKHADQALVSDESNSQPTAQVVDDEAKLVHVQTQNEAFGVQHVAAFQLPAETTHHHLWRSRYR